MAFSGASNVINVMLAVVNFHFKNKFPQMKFGICIRGANRHIVNWQRSFAVL